jgi:hypothetical protein
VTFVAIVIFELKPSARADHVLTFDKSMTKEQRDGGKTAEVRLRRQDGNSNAPKPPVIMNLKYWGALRNDGFVLMPERAADVPRRPESLRVEGRERVHADARHELHGRRESHQRGHEVDLRRLTSAEAGPCGVRLQPDLSAPPDRSPLPTPDAEDPAP